MPKTTPDKLLMIANHLNGLTTEALQQYIDDAFLEVEDMKVKEEHEEILSRYLAAHFASLNVRRVVSMKADVLSQTYSNEATAGRGLDSTVYGQEFKRLSKRYGGRPRLNMVVV